MTPIKPLSVTTARRRRRRFPRRSPVRTVVWLQGEHDLSTVDALSATFAEAIAHEGGGDVVADLSDVQFMGAATVGVLIRAHELLRLRSRSLVVRSPSWCARRVLELCGDTDLLDRAEAAPLTGTTGALGTWVPVPATDPVDHPAGTLAKHPRAPDPIGVGDVTAARATSVDAAHRVDELPSDVAGVGAP